MRHYAASVATLEDKIVQRAVVEVLNAVYEADFRGFFGQLGRGWLERFLRHRIADERVRGWPASGWPRESSRTGPGRLVRGAHRSGHRFSRCSLTCTCITCWTCGPAGGGGSSPAVM